MRKLMLSLAGFRSAFGVMSAYRDVAAVVTGSMGVPGRFKYMLDKSYRLERQWGAGRRMELGSNVLVGAWRIEWAEGSGNSNSERRNKQPVEGLGLVSAVFRLYKIRYRLTGKECIKLLKGAQATPSAETPQHHHPE
ncbi:Uncharacterized protein TCM_002549 [Theobroma cacao]|uniref:Uncharacterized protein n=1 Tax=Theobroma cacao TaxID=3641 RepID=A0A061DLY0_THECC|nr:Uncharacterized protein TCM_002549 [Theobroma cacao]